MSYIIGFLLIIGIAVAVHEFFHFYPAKKLGIKVLKFSIGMGKPLKSWKGKDGVDYQIAMLPIGGYVQMLEQRALTPEERASYSEQELAQAFDVQPVWKKMIVILGGPVSNLVLALLIYAAIAMAGVSYVKPVIGDIASSGWAVDQPLQAKDEFLSINNNDVTNWQDFTRLLINNLGNDNVSATIKRDDSVQQITLDVSQFEISRGMDLFQKLGIIPIHQAVAPVVGQFASQSPAQKAGIEKGDIIQSVNGESVDYWQDVVSLIHAKPSETVSVVIERNGEQKTFEIETLSKTVGDEQVGLIGISVSPQSFNDEYVGTEQHSFFGSFVWGYDKMSGMVVHSVSTLKMIATGQVSVDNLSGPVGIAKFSGEALQNGIISFLSLMALINVSLGILNLLPLPVLDGGHVVIYSIEAVLKLFGKQLNEAVVMAAQNIGGGVLLLFMAYVIVNDVLYIF